MQNNKFWIEKWQTGQIGFHLEEVNPLLIEFWPKLAQGKTVLVPLCGKSKDLIWLAQQNLKVVGVELSEVAIKDFFKENRLTYHRVLENGVMYYQAKELSILLVQQDFFEFKQSDFDACYDRAALVAFPANMRVAYSQHLKRRLKPDAITLLVTLDYAYQDQNKLAQSPPFNVCDEEVANYWPSQLSPVFEQSLYELNSRYAAKGYQFFDEKVWLIG